MATTRKKTTATARSTTKKTVEAVESIQEVITPVSADPVVETVVETKTVEKREFKPDTGIPCTSITVGELIVIGPKTGMRYDWLTRGDTIDVEYQDLVAAIRMNKDYIKQPYFIVEDEDFLNENPQLRNVYGSMYSLGDLQGVIIDLDPMSMKLTIESLPQGARESIRNIASTMIQNGQIDSVGKIKMLDEIYGTNFMLISGLYEN